MIKSILGLVLIICLASCSSEVNIKPVIDTAEVDFKDLQARYDLADEVDKEELVGEWKRISSFFTTEKSGAQGIPLRNLNETFKLNKDGTYQSKVEHTSKVVWNLEKGNTIFTVQLKNGEPGDKWRIRLANDTFELIQKQDEDFLYEAYARVK